MEAAPQGSDLRLFEEVMASMGKEELAVRSAREADEPEMAAALVALIEEMGVIKNGEPQIWVNQV
jgi:hypothetical protein